MPLSTRDTLARLYMQRPYTLTRHGIHLATGPFGKLLLAAARELNPREPHLVTLSEAQAAGYQLTPVKKERPLCGNPSS